MNRLKEIHRATISRADWFQYDKMNGLRLDGYYEEADLKAFIWAMENDQDWLETNSREK